MPNIVIAPEILVAGLRTEFADTYLAIRNRQASGLLGKVMDLSIRATTRQHTFGYFDAAPHAELWRRGDPIPQDGMSSKAFSVAVHNWGRRVKWHVNDREDDQTASLFDAARMAGESFGLLPERAFFDLLTGSLTTLPSLPTAPDGAAFFATTDGSGAARFGVSGGNLVTGTSVSNPSDVQTDYYKGIARWMQMQDGKGQPLFSPETIGAGALVIHSAADQAVFEQAFLQRRIGMVRGTDAGVTPSNVIQDASRNVMLWGTPRIPTGSWYMFLLQPPKLPTFQLERKEVIERSSLEGQNNGDHTRTTGEEYIQWDSRSGYGIGLPYAAVKINI
jgi:phage major head subunit gpT-like protein